MTNQSWGRSKKCLAICLCMLLSAPTQALGLSEDRKAMLMVTGWCVALAGSISLIVLGGIGMTKCENEEEYSCKGLSEEASGGYCCTEEMGAVVSKLPRGLETNCILNTTALCTDGNFPNCDSDPIQPDPVCIDYEENAENPGCFKPLFTMQLDSDCELSNGLMIGFGILGSALTLALVIRV